MKEGLTLPYIHILFHIRTNIQYNKYKGLTLPIVYKRYIRIPMVYKKKFVKNSTDLLRILNEFLIT